jgi:hypothetical protein
MKQLAARALQIADPGPLPEEASNAVTIHLGSDCNPGTIIDAKGSIVFVRPDRFKVISGSEADGSAKYRYYADETAPIEAYRQDKNGRYQAVGQNPVTGRWIKTYGRISIGRRRRYYDPHF